MYAHVFCEGAVKEKQNRKRLRLTNGITRVEVWWIIAGLVVCEI